MINEFQGNDGKTYAWLDSDTVTDGATSYRLKGFNALETPHVFEDEEGNLRFKQGQQGGKAQTEATKRIAAAGGFTNIVDDGEEDKFGRKLISLQDEYGNELSDTLYQSGLLTVDKYTTEDGLKARQYGELEREAGIANPYASIAQEEMPEKPIYMKDTPILEQAFGEIPLDENSYAQQVIQVIANQNGLNLSNPDDMREASKILDSGSYDKRSIAFENLQFRSPDRTKEGVAYNQTSTAWNQGWGGLATGWKGFAEIAGVLVGSKDLQDWAGRKVEVAKEDLLNEPRLRSMDYRDIDSVWDGFRFMTNNMAMSAPYLVTLLSGAVLSPFTFGASVPIALGSVGGSYAGQVFNDIEGPKGRAQASGAILAGTIMTALDYLGMKGFMRPGEFLTKRGKVQILQAMMQTGKYKTKAAAKKALNNASRRAIRETIDGIGNFALLNVAKPSLMKEMAKGSVRGATFEGVTEAAQEGVGYLASKSMSEGGLEKNFDMDEFKNLLAQSAVAGSSLGSSFGTAGALVREGQNRSLMADLAAGDRSKLSEYAQVREEFKPEKTVTEDGRVISENIETIIEGNKKGVASSQANETYLSKPDYERIDTIPTYGNPQVGLLENTDIDSILNSTLQDIERLKTERDSTKQGTNISGAQQRPVEAIRRELNDARITLKALNAEKALRDSGVEPLTLEQAKNIQVSKQTKVKPANRPDSVASAYRLEGEARKAQEKRDRTTWDKLKNFKKWLPLGYRAGSTSVFTPALLRKSKTLRKLASLVGTALGNIYSGVNASGYAAILRSMILQTLNPKGILKAFNLSDKQSNYNYISTLLRAYMEAKRTGAQLTPDMINNQLALEQTIKNLNDSLQQVYDEEFKMEQMDNSFFKRRVVDKQNPQWLNAGTFDWRKVRENKEAWLSFMKANALAPDNKPYLDVELNILYNKISNNEDATDFSMVDGSMWRPNDFKQKNGEPLSALEGFKQFANTDIVQNQIKLIDQSVKYITYTKYFGRGGQDLDYMFKQMEDEGALTPEEMQEVAMGVKDIIDADTGNYNRIESKELSFWQRKASFFSAIIGLPMSVLASFVEYAMLLYQGPQSSTVRKGITKAIKEMVSIIKNIENMPQNPALQNIPDVPKSNKAVQRLSATGMYDDDAVAATRLGMGEADIAQAWWMKQFFKFTLIAPQTTFQRAGMAALASGVVSDRLRLLWAARQNDGTVNYNQKQLAIYQQLADIGLDVDAMIDMFDKYTDPEMYDVLYEADFSSITDPKEREQAKSDAAFIQDQMQVATWYFTNERIQNPQGFNRPLIFQDPHYQLFLQFNGFISNFTAVIIPRLWQDYIKNGTPAMRYNTFALIVLMMALAGVSQWLKDYIKFGKSSPYLTDFQLVQRALMASGILGSGERVLQAVAPLYKDRNEGIIDRIFGESIGGAPFVRNIETAGKSLMAFAEGDTRRGVGGLTKLTPGIAPFTPGRRLINQIMHGDRLEPY